MTDPMAPERLAELRARAELAKQPTALAAPWTAAMSDDRLRARPHRTRHHPMTPERLPDGRSPRVFF